MALLDYFVPSSLTSKLMDLLLGQHRIEATAARIEDNTQRLQIIGEIVMTSLKEIKNLTTTAFAENSESLQLAIAKIDELKAKLPNPEDGAIADEIAEALRSQIAANDEFQAKLNPPPTEEPVSDSE